MKKKSFKKTNLVKGILLATLAFCGSAFAGDCSQQALQAGDEVEFAPFMEVDYTATFAQLPEQTRTEAQTLLAEIDAIYDAIPEAMDNGAEDSVLDETEQELLEKEIRLEGLLDDAEVELVTVNLLDKLDAEQRARAEQLWDEIEDLAETVENDDSVLNVEEKTNELEAILDSVKS